MNWCTCKTYSVHSAAKLLNYVGRLASILIGLVNFRVLLSFYHIYHCILVTFDRMRRQCYTDLVTSIWQITNVICSIKSAETFTTITVSSSSQRRRSLLRRKYHHCCMSEYQYKERYHNAALSTRLPTVSLRSIIRLPDLIPGHWSSNTPCPKKAATVFLGITLTNLDTVL